MNKSTIIAICAAALTLGIFLTVVLVACGSNKDGTEDGTGGGNPNPDVNVEVGEGDDGNVNIEIDLGDHTGNNNNNGIDPDDGKITYEEYWSWTAEEREEYFNGFASEDEFFDWYNAMVNEYNNRVNAPEIGADGEINLGGQ